MIKAYIALFYIIGLAVVCKILDHCAKHTPKPVLKLDVLETKDHLVPLSGLYAQSIGRGIRTKETK